MEEVFESVAERRIREAMERGEFDDLPGHGKPLPDAGQPYEELWWVKKWLKRNQLTERPPQASLSGPPAPPEGERFNLRTPPSESSSLSSGRIGEAEPSGRGCELDDGGFVGRAAAGPRASTR